VTEYARRSARVVLLDARERVLLWHVRWDTGRPELGEGWCTPGGGVDPGESLAEAAARELAEETGLAVPPAALGEVVAWSEGYAELSFASGTFRDDHFLLRVDAHEVSTAGHEALERGHILGHRWWAVEELEAAGAVTVPMCLTWLIRAAREGRLPGTPVRLPWRYGRRRRRVVGAGVAEEVLAEMVANVWKVVVAQGDEVAEGDTLVILESMKMEIPVVTESGGTVKELRVNEGDVVQEGDVIAVVE
jgi:pyruvate carboxylase